MGYAMGSTRTTAGIFPKTGMLATMVLTSGIWATGGVVHKPAAPQNNIPSQPPFVTTWGQLTLSQQALTTSPSVARVLSQPAMSFAESRLRAEIAKYESLPSDWDGYGAEPASRSALNDLLVFLNQLPPGIDFPKITLASSGLPSLYWDSSEFFADLEFSDGSEISLFTISKKTREEGYFQFNSVDEAVMNISGYLTKRSV